MDEEGPTSVMVRMGPEEAFIIAGGLGMFIQDISYTIEDTEITDSDDEELLLADISAKMIATEMYVKLWAMLGVSEQVSIRKLAAMDAVAEAPTPEPKRRWFRRSK